MLQRTLDMYRFASAFLPRFRFEPNEEKQSDIATFIQSGYADCYSADIQVAMPYLLNLSFASKDAALGMRNAREPLFVEHYLPKPIEQHTNDAFGINDRNVIVEYGNLYSNGPKLITPLFMLSTVALMQCGIKVLAFCATKRVASILQSYGLELTYLVDAKQESLPASNDFWGSYYKTNPKVYLLNLEQLSSVIAGNPKYSQLFRLLSPAINKLSRKFIAEGVC